MSLSMRPTKAEDDAIRQRLKHHRRLTQKYMSQGHDSETASRKAYNAIKGTKLKDLSKIEAFEGGSDVVVSELSFYEGYLEGKRRQDEIAKKASLQVDETAWAVYAGGTGSHPKYSSYSKSTDHGEYHINPPPHGQRGHRLLFAHTHQTPDSQKKMGHSGLWHDLGTFSHPHHAMGAANRHEKFLKSK
jgi:hypothetical protein